MSGLVLMTDVSVSGFLKGGKVIELMAAIGGFKSVDEMYRNGVPRAALDRVESTLKSRKIRLVHLGHRKIFKEFGPPANHPDSAFTADDGSLVTVAKYFEDRARESDVYRNFLESGKLKYPNLPTINVGSRKKQILIPVELAEVIPGQAKTQGLPGEIASTIIKQAAMVPADRFRHIDVESKRNGVLRELQNEENSVAFGFNAIHPSPMKVQGFILPYPKLQYKGRVVEPELRGTWNLSGGIQFAYPAKSDTTGDNRLPYGVIIVYRDRQPGGQERLIDDFANKIESESRIVNIPLRLCSAPSYVADRPDQLEAAFANFKNHQGARIVICLLHYDAYPLVKLAADGQCMPTQCVKWSNLVRPPKSYYTSLLVKMNYKMGGVNHTLASRLPRGGPAPMDTGEEPPFQSPPKSISWLFDEPCMVMGIDVSHPEKGDTKSRSIAACVASMDGMLGQCKSYSVVFLYSSYQFSQ
jgi:eukaryotic translation initiation factor 2C